MSAGLPFRTALRALSAATRLNDPQAWRCFAALHGRRRICEVSAHAQRMVHTSIALDYRSECLASTTTRPARGCRNMLQPVDDRMAQAPTAPAVVIDCSLRRR